MQPINPSKIIWIKSVDRNETPLWAYCGEDPTTRHFEPQRDGDEFDLHWPTRKRRNAERPRRDDVICLIQDRHVTHLVQVLDDGLHARPPEHVDVSSLQQLRRTLQAHEVWGARAFGLATGRVRARALGLRAANLQRYMDQLLEKEHPQLRDYKNDLDSCGRQLGGFEVKVFPASLVPVFVTLAVMALAGIVWPLSILPGLEVTSKTWMLLSLTVGLIALFVYFAQVFLALWGLGRMSWPEPETEG